MSQLQESLKAKSDTQEAAADSGAHQLQRQLVEQLEVAVSRAGEQLHDCAMPGAGRAAANNKCYK